MHGWSAKRMAIPRPLAGRATRLVFESATRLFRGRGLYLVTTRLCMWLYVCSCACGCVCGRVCVAVCVAVCTLYEL